METPITHAIRRLLSAWPLVVKRSLAHSRLLSAVVIGVVFASAVMAGTVIYFDSLRDLALDNSLDKHTDSDLNILLTNKRGPSTADEYAKVFQLVEGEINFRLAWLLENRIRGGRTPTFFLSRPGDEGAAGESDQRSFFAFLEGLQDRSTLLPGGSLPSSDATIAEDGPLELEALIPIETAELFGVGVGDRLSAVPTRRDGTPYVSVLISGVFERSDPDNEYWQLDNEVFLSSTQSFDTAPFYVSEESFLKNIGAAFPSMTSSYAWLLEIDRNNLRAEDAQQAFLGLRVMEDRLSSNLQQYRQLTSLDAAIREFDQRLLFSKLQMFVVLIVIAIVVLYYVVTLSSLLVEQQRSEIVLLRIRGASPRQVLAVFVLEGATISILATIVAPILAALAISFMGVTPVFSELTGGSRLPVTITRNAYLLSALGGLLSFAALMIPAMQASRISASRDRQESSRPAQLPFFQRYYLDVMLLVFSLVLFRQLTEQGSVAATGVFGEVVVNQLLLAVPAIILVASAMVLLRIFPLVMGLASRLLSSRLTPGLVMGLWQMARNPTHYARLALLLILMAGLGILAASFTGTLERSSEDRVLYFSGSDIRLEGVRLNNRGRTRPLVANYEQIEGVDQASPAFRDGGQILSGNTRDSFEMFGIDRSSFTDVAWFRDDFTSKPLSELMDSLEYEAKPQGIPLPDDTRSIAALVKPDRPRPDVLVTARLRDSNNRYFTYRLGTLSRGNWALLEANLFERGNPRFNLFPERPLSLVSISIHRFADQGSLDPGSILIDDIRATRATSEIEVLESFRDIDGWNVIRERLQAAPDQIQSSEVSARRDGSMMFSWNEGTRLTSRGIYPGPDAAPIPVLASMSFLRATGHGVGDEIEISIRGREFPVQLVDTIDFFPTLDTVGDRFLISDLDSLIEYANLGSINFELTPNEIWISSNASGDDRQALINNLTSEESRALFGVGEVHDRAGLMADSRRDPLVTAGWQALLFIAFSAILVLSGIGFLVHAYISFRNREREFALMRTIGFSMRQLTSLMFLEQALVIIVGMALGTWMGRRLGGIILPFLAHDDRGFQLVPPFVIEVTWGNLILTYIAMAGVFVVIILSVIWLIRRMALSRVMRLGEM